MTARRTFYKTSAAARAARRTAARASEAVPLLACVPLLSHRQWKAGATALAMLHKRAFGRGNVLIYTTAAETALASDVSYGTARRALRALRRMGMLRHHPASGSRPEMFMPRMWP